MILKVSDFLGYLILQYAEIIYRRIVSLFTFHTSFLFCYSYHCSGYVFISSFELWSGLGSNIFFQSHISDLYQGNLACETVCSNFIFFLCDEENITKDVD